MLEIKDLVRIYKPKKGESFRALDGVSLKFPDTGMIFLLGKSGSGKSTLLNVMGGLDKYDNGEIIIKGKSFKNFTQDDLASCRNTYFSFILQEQNLINGLSVRETLELALQMQRKEVTALTIDKILAEVGIVNESECKIEKLSVAQKQRVAIALALAKESKIIIADEPSRTLHRIDERQFMDTLKRLSKNRLVIIGTCDKEIADIYGDRIIEIKDGKVISDIEKYDSITLESCSINDTANKISKDDSLRLIKCKFPFINSLGIAFNCFKHKKFILALTMILSLLTFALFGLASAFSAYEKYDIFSKSIISSDIESLSFSMQYGNNKSDKIPLTKMDIEELNKETGLVFKSVFNDRNLTAYSLHNFSEAGLLTMYYTKTISGFYEISSIKELEDLGFSVIGNMPSSDSEIGITKYTFSHYQKAGYIDENYNSYSPENVAHEELFLSKAPVISIDNKNYLVTAIIDTNINYEKFCPLDKDIDMLDSNLLELFKEFSIQNRYGYHSFAFVKEGFVEHFEAEKNNAALNIEKLGEVNLNDKNNWYKLTSYRLAKTSMLAEQNCNFLYFDDSDTTLGENDVIINLKDVAHYIRDTVFVDLLNADSNSILYGYACENIDSAIAGGFEYTQYEDAAFEYYIYLINDGYEKSDYGPSGKEIYKSVYAGQLGDYIKSNTDIKTLAGKLNVKYSLNYPHLEESSVLSFNLKGFYLGEENMKGVLCVNEKLFNLYDDINQYKYSFAITAMPKDYTKLKEISKFYLNQNHESSFFVMQNKADVPLTQINAFFAKHSCFFLYMGLGCLFFNLLMISYYIFSSANYKKRDIGILRALGAKRKDVLGIFFNESLNIAIINFILATILAIIAKLIINVSFKNIYGITITFLNLGTSQIALMLGVSLSVAFASFLLPAIRIIRKQPADFIIKTGS